MTQTLPREMDRTERTAAGSGSVAPVSPQRALGEPDWQERLAPVLFEFKAKGDVLDGLLIRGGLIEITDKDSGKKKQVPGYSIRKRDGQVFKIIGTYDINQKLGPDDVGSLVEITYLGENPNVKRGDNFMRDFRVRVAVRKSAPAKFTDGTEITDEDIPF